MATERQKNAFDKVVENGGNVSSAMREVGYSEETAKTPQKLTESKGWIELMEEHIPKTLIAQRHRDLLNKVDEQGQIDVAAVRAGVDMGHKLWGNYAPEKSISLNVNADITNPKAKELADKYEEELKRNL